MKLLPGPINPVLLLFFTLISVCAFADSRTPALGETSLFIPGQRLIAGDPDSPDDPAHPYKTGVIDSRVLQVPLALNNRVKTQPDKALKELIDFLLAGAENQFHITKRIYDWVSLHIAYDATRNYDTDSDDPYELLLLERTTCGGFGRLIKECQC